MSKPNIILHKFKLPIFKATVWVIIGTSIRKAIDYIEDITSEKIAIEEEKKNIRAYTYAYETEDNKRRYMLFFKYNAKPGEIAHEAKHMVNILFSWHGYRLSISNDEMECYYLEDIVDNIHRIINKYNKHFKKKSVSIKINNAILSPKTEVFI